MSANMTPRMKLSPGDYITPDFRAEMDIWLIDFFGYKEDEKPALIVHNDANLQAKQPASTNPAIKRNRAKRGSSTPSTKTMSDMLDSIAETFKNLELDIDGVSFSRMLKNEVMGLKKCSPLVVNKTIFDGGIEQVFVNRAKGLPTLFVVAVNQGHDDDKLDTLAPDFAFGMKVKKVPWNVTRLTGDVYLFGMAWRVAGKHIWNGFWLSVRPDGSIQVADELQNIFVSTAQGSYAKRSWEKSSWSGPSNDRESAIRHCFSQTLGVYQERNNKWNIGVSNGRKRIIFLIEQEHAKTYFQNRNKVVTENGRTKPIIHFVRSHQQHHGDKVVDIPEHIRGLRQFEWAGYKCTVTAPQFHVHLSSKFDLAADTTAEDEVDENKTMDISKLADFLNDLEDNNIRKAKK